MKKKKGVVTVDDIDRADVDISFVRAFVDMIFSIDSGDRLDELKSGTVSSMCSESLNRIEKLKSFIDSIPANALPKDIIRAKAAAKAA